MKYNKLIVCLILLLCPLMLFPEAKSSFGNKASEWFDKMNIVSNTTSSDSINSQLGVHYLGGHGTVKSGVVSTNPIHVSLPTISAGCGGIDYTMGAINIASKDEMKKALKSIASNGTSYAFLLALETASPQVGSTVKSVQHWANQLNAININSCEIASTLVQGAWPKVQGASQYICSHTGTSNGLFKDLIEARHGCRDDSKKTEETQKIAKKNKGFLAGSYNIAWEILKNDGQLDQQTKELFLTIVGTIVVTNKSDGNPQIAHHPSKLDDAMKVILQGGTIENAYRMGKDGVSIQKTELFVSQDEAWKNKVRKNLSSIQDKILAEAHGERSSLSLEERQLLQGTKFPIGSLTSIMAQWSGNAANLASLDECSEIIAFEKLSSFVDQVITKVLNQAEALQKIQIDGTIISDYIKGLYKAQGRIREIETRNHEQLSKKHQIIDFLMNVDKGMREKGRGA